MTLGVTGSFGKTIAALMVRSILEAAGERFGLVGALGFCDGTTTRALGAGVVRRGGRTLVLASASAITRPTSSGAFAPGAAGLATLLAEMVERGCKGGVLEVSSERSRTAASRESPFTRRS